MSVNYFLFVCTVMLEAQNVSLLLVTVLSHCGIQEMPFVYVLFSVFFWNAFPLYLLTRAVCLHNYVTRYLFISLAGTWSQTRGHTIHGHTVPPQLVKALRSKTLSQERRRSDEELSPKQGKSKASQSPSRKPGGTSFFDAFRPRSKSDATSKGRKSTNLISQMKNAVQVSLSAFEYEKNNDCNVSLYRLIL